MISPARAGYGRSDQNSKPDVDELIDSGVDDMIELLDHIGVRNAYLMTGWGGAFAQRLAIKDRHRIKGIVFSGAVPVWEPEHLHQLAPRYRNMIKTSIHAPQVVPYLVRIAKALIESGQSKLFIDSLDIENSTDQKAARSSDVYETLEKRFKFLVEQSTLAFTQDLASIHTDWTHDTIKLNQPVALVMGDKNTDQPKGAVKKFIENVKHSKLFQVEGAGTYQNLTHFNHILRAVDSFENR